MTLGETIKEYRNKHSLSMDAFSEKSGISKAYISLLEKNKHPKTGKPIAPSIQCIKQAAHGMEMDFNDLFNALDCDVSLEDSMQEICFDSELENNIGMEQRTKPAYEILSEIMKNRNLKIAEVARLCDLPDGTVRGIIKREQKDIALKVALKLSKGLGVSIEYLNGMPERKKSSEELRKEKLSQYEHIVDKYRFISTHSPDGASVVDTVLDREYAIAKKLKEQSEQIQKMDMEVAEEIIPARIISYHQRLASAGNGQVVFDDTVIDRIEIPDISKYKRVSYAIGVNGRSMEPLFNDGDILLIEPTCQVEVGEIGIFIVDGEAFVKKLGNGELISLNKGHGNIPLTEYSNCMGRVVDKLNQD